MAHLKTLLLGLLFLIGAWYLVGELIFAASRDRGELDAVDITFRFSHVLFTLPLLLLPIVQFSQGLRSRRPAVHRGLGRLYLISAILASIGALYLGLTFEETGRRPPLVVFAALWLLFSLAAWICARRRSYAAHANFVLRSYGVALAFVLVRVLNGFESQLFGFIESDEVRNVTREWLAFVVPLVVIELGISWLPALRRRKGASAPATS